MRLSSRHATLIESTCLLSFRLRAPLPDGALFRFGHGTRTRTEVSAGQEEGNRAPLANLRPDRLGVGLHSSYRRNHCY
jgi:hypothetical protein